MSGLLETIIPSGNVQGQAGAVALQAVDAGINALASAVGAGGVLSAIVSMLSPSAASGPTLTDLQNQLQAYQQQVIDQFDAMNARLAGGQIQTWENELQQVLSGPDGPLTVIGEIPAWKKDPGLPLTDSYNPSPGQCQTWARAALSLLVGIQSAVPPGSPPTSYWYIPAGDLPLFKPDNPWTYTGTTRMFNQPDVEDIGDGIGNDMNPYTSSNLYAGGIPSFDLSLFHFTNDFSPTQVTGVPENNAFNPTWVLQQSMAAVTYYLILCGAVIKDFPNDGATVLDFTGSPNPVANFNFLGGLSWYHDQIRAGIVCIAPPDPRDVLPFPSGIVGDDSVFPASANAGVSGWSVPCSNNPGLVPDASSAPPSLWSRPFGALCNYNNFVAGYGGPQPSVDGYPDYVYPTPGQPIYYVSPPPHSESVATLPVYASGTWYTGFYCKYLVACLWRTKLVYNGMGLADMWRTVNNLYGMFGKPPRPGPCFGDWSLREVFRVLGSADYTTFPLPALEPSGVESPEGSKYTVRAFLQFMNSAAPTSATPMFSLRATLEA